MGKNPNFQIHPSDRFLLGGSTFVDNKFNKTLNLKTLKPNPEPLKVEFGNTATMAVYGLRSPINCVNTLARPEVLKHNLRSRPRIYIRAKDMALILGQSISNEQSVTLIGSQ